MSGFEVPKPILNPPFEEPKEHWFIEEGREPERHKKRRDAGYFYRDPRVPVSEGANDVRGQWVPLVLVNLIRMRIKEWREQGYPGVTRTSLELLQYWRREGREHRLFFAQIEAAETTIFLTEARPDFRQGIDVPSDEPSNDHKAEGYEAFRRYACKMATATGKTTVMGMLAAWSILNKVNDRGNARFSDVVLVVCPNVTIRNRLQEIDPAGGEASLYRKRDLVPPHLMPDLNKGRVLVTNWHVFEPQGIQTGGVSAKVSKAGIPVRVQGDDHHWDEDDNGPGQAIPHPGGPGQANRGRPRRCEERGPRRARKPAEGRCRVGKIRRERYLPGQPRTRPGGGREEKHPRLQR